LAAETAPSDRGFHRPARLEKGKAAQIEARWNTEVGQLMTVLPTAIS
jgi:hypothetical protein